MWEWSETFFYKIDSFKQLEYKWSFFPSNCLHTDLIERWSSTDESAISEFSFDDVTSHQIIFGRKNCQILHRRGVETVSYYLYVAKCSFFIEPR